MMVPTSPRVVSIAGLWRLSAAALCLPQQQNLDASDRPGRCDGGTPVGPETACFLVGRSLRRFSCDRWKPRCRASRTAGRARPAPRTRRWPRPSAVPGTPSPRAGPARGSTAARPRRAREPTPHLRIGLSAQSLTGAPEPSCAGRSSSASSRPSTDGVGRTDRCARRPPRLDCVRRERVQLRPPRADGPFVPRPNP